MATPENSNPASNVTPTGNPSKDDHPSNPYFLHFSESPGSHLVSQLLLISGENYHTWNRSMLITLEAKNKLGFLDRSLPRPLSTDPLFGAWSRCNNMIFS